MVASKMIFYLIFSSVKLVIIGKWPWKQSSFIPFVVAISLIFQTYRSLTARKRVKGRWESLDKSNEKFDLSSFILGKSGSMQWQRDLILLLVGRSGGIWMVQWYVGKGGDVYLLPHPWWTIPGNWSKYFYRSFAQHGIVTSWDLYYGYSFFKFYSNPAPGDCCFF